jgi:hypothetical protein
MTSADVEGPVQAKPIYLTNPCRRRSGTGMPASTTVQHDYSSSNGQHHSTLSCCNHYSHEHGQSQSHCSTHVVSHGHAHASPTAAIAPQQLHHAGMMRGSSSAAGAAGQQGLMRSASLGLVTTRIHAAAICCRYLHLQLYSIVAA